jgi:cbb3-type cytochrome oxidase subunit 1
MPFIDVLKATLPFLRASTTGDLLMACGHLVFLANLLGIVRTATRSCISSFLALNKTAEVAP